MFHYNEPVQDRQGNGLVGYFIGVVTPDPANPTGGSEATIYADANGTAIVSVSGVDNRAKVDEDGMVSFYVTEGSYHIDLYGPDGTTQLKRYYNIPMLSAAVNTTAAASVGSRSLMAAISSPVSTQSVYLSEAGREGTFVFSTSNLSSQVTADTQQGTYVAPSSDTTGASGAWVRHPGIDTWFNVRHFGAVGDDVTDDYSACQCALNVAKLTGGTVWFPVGLYHLNTGLVLSLSADGPLNVRIVGTPGSWLRTASAIDLLTISNTNASAANTRRVNVDCLAFLVNNAGARGLVLTKASYNDFSNLEFLGTGTGIVVGTANEINTIHNQFTNIRVQQIGNGLYLGGQYNIVTNFVCGEGITSQYAIQFDGAGNTVTGFVARGVGGSGGTATINITGNSAGCTLSSGYIFDSYAIGVAVGAAKNVKINGVTITNSQTHGLQINGALQSKFDVTVTGSSAASANVSSHINCINTPTDNTVLAQFNNGTYDALYDINEASGSNNVYICGTLPNGNSIAQGSGAVVIANGCQQPNVRLLTAAATVTPTFSNDAVHITAQNAALTLANPTGTAVSGKKLTVRIKDDGTPRAISYGTQYRAMDVALPTTTVAGKITYLQFEYNGTDTKWDAVRVAQQA